MTAAPRELTFPVDWTFRIIVAADAEGCEDELRKVFAAFGLSPALTEGLRSSTGKYRTLVAPVTLDSRRSLDELPKALAAVAGVKTVL